MKFILYNYITNKFIFFICLLIFIYSCSNSSHSINESPKKITDSSRNRIHSKAIYAFSISPNVDQENNPDAKIIFAEVQSRLVESGLNLVYKGASIGGVTSQKADYELLLSKVNVRYVKFRTKLKLEIEIQCIHANSKKILWIEKIYHIRNVENTDKYIEYSILADKTVEKLRNKGRI
jgi:putative lipase involved disintegration of autophagic bodies